MSKKEDAIKIIKIGYGEWKISKKKAGRGYSLEREKDIIREAELLETTIECKDFDTEEEAIKCKKQLINSEKEKREYAKIIANIMINNLLKHTNRKKCKIDELELAPEDLAWLAEMVHFDILDSTKVSTIIDHFMTNGGTMFNIVEELDLWPKYNDGLEEMIEQVISDNPKIVEQIKGGKHKAIGSLIGKLKQIDKSIDSKEAMELLKKKLL